MSQVNKFSILEISQFFVGVVVAMVFVMNWVIGGFNWVDWVASIVRQQPTVRLQLYQVICEK